MREIDEPLQWLTASNELHAMDTFRRDDMERIFRPCILGKILRRQRQASGDVSITGLFLT